MNKLDSSKRNLHTCCQGLQAQDMQLFVMERSTSRCSGRKPLFGGGAFQH